MALERITDVSGKGVFLPGNDIDTDRIIPARFMVCVTFEGLGKYAFYDERKNADGQSSSVDRSEKAKRENFAFRRKLRVRFFARTCSAVALALWIPRDNCGEFR